MVHKLNPQIKIFGVRLFGKQAEKEVVREKNLCKTVEQYAIPSHYKGVQDLDWQWLAGWFQGDGCVKAHIKINRTSQLKYLSCVYISTVQHNKSLYIMRDIAVALGKRKSQVTFQRRTAVSLEVSHRKQLKDVLQKFKDQFVGDKWFDYQACTYLSKYQLENGTGGRIERQLQAANYIVHHFKNNGKKADKNAFIRLKIMQSNAAALGCDYDIIHQNCELVPYQSHLPQRRLHDRFLLGFIEAEGCFHIRLRGNIGRYPLVGASPIFFMNQHGKKNRCILEQVQYRFGGGGCIVDIRNQISYLIIYNQKQIAQYVIPFFQMNTPLSAKYFDFAKLTEIFWGKLAGKHKSQSWTKQMIYMVFEMNTNKLNRTYRTSYSIAQFLFYLTLAKSQQEVKLKKRNLKTFKLMVFDWVKYWRYSQGGTEKQKLKALKWFREINEQSFQLYLQDYEECRCEVLNILGFVANQVRNFENDKNTLVDVDYTWFEQQLSNNSEMEILKKKPFVLVMSQLKCESVQKSCILK